MSELLSNLIERGYEQALPIEGQYITRNEAGEVYACALGAAYVGVRGLPDGTLKLDNWTVMEVVTPLIGYNPYVTTLPHPVHYYNDAVACIIVNLNDTNHWPPTRIIEWLRSQGL